MYSGRRATVEIQRVPQNQGIAVLDSARGIDPRAPRALLMGLPSGPAGTVATLKIMKRLAREAIRSPNQLVRNKALEIFRNAGLPPRDWFGQIRALQAWVQNCIRYVQDPVDVELVQTPEVTLKLGTGDCDDQATLLASMLESTGHLAKFVAIGVKGGPFSHVLVETKTGRGWAAAETILKKPFGWYPPDATSRYELNLS
jgi:transglutaminase-like putative cysteine protease